MLLRFVIPKMAVTASMDDVNIGLVFGSQLCFNLLEPYSSFIRKVCDLTNSERISLYMVCMPSALTCETSPLPCLTAPTPAQLYPQTFPYNPQCPQLLPVKLCRGTPQLTTIGLVWKMCCLADCHVSRHWSKGSFDVTQIFLLYHSTELRANFLLFC